MPKRTTSKKQATKTAKKTRSLQIKPIQLKKKRRIRTRGKYNALANQARKVSNSEKVESQHIGEKETFVYESKKARKIPSDYEVKEFVEIILSNLKGTRSKTKVQYKKMRKWFHEKYKDYEWTDKFRNQVIDLLIQKNIVVVDIANELDDIIDSMSQGRASRISKNDKLIDSNAWMVSSLNKCKLLTRQEEIKLFQMLNSPNEEHRDFARNKIVVSNLRLVVKMVHGYMNHGLPNQDLFQAGVQGLLETIAKFDYKRGIKFSTYATCWIRQAINRATSEFGKTIRVPVHMNEQINKMNKMEAQMSNQLGRLPTLDELQLSLAKDNVKFQDLKLHNLKKIATNTASLDKQVDSSKDNNFVDFAVDNDLQTPDQAFNERFRHEKIIEILGKTLTQEELEIICMRYGIYYVDKNGNVFNREYTLEEIAQGYGTTKENIRQKEAKAIRKLKSPNKLKLFTTLVS